MTAVRFFITTLSVSHPDLEEGTDIYEYVYKYNMYIYIYIYIYIFICIFIYMYKDHLTRSINYRHYYHMITMIVMAVILTLS
jgi:L-asparagine transporter-like permease